MSVLVRFKTKFNLYKARIFERASKKHVCCICNRKAYGILIRHISPKKMDTGICNECLVRITHGRQITIEGDTGHFYGKHPKKPQVAGRKRGPKIKPGVKAGGRNTECEICGKMFTAGGFTRHVLQMHPTSTVEADLDGITEPVPIESPKEDNVSDGAVGLVSEAQVHILNDIPVVVTIQDTPTGEGTPNGD